LKARKAFLERRELLKELFLREFLLREAVYVLVMGVDEICHDDTPLCSQSFWLLGRAVIVSRDDRSAPVIGQLNRIFASLLRSLDD
jgi:hypothetical protein